MVRHGYIPGGIHDALVLWYSCDLNLMRDPVPDRLYDKNVATSNYMEALRSCIRRYLNRVNQVLIVSPLASRIRTNQTTISMITGTVPTSCGAQRARDQPL